MRFEFATATRIIFGVGVLKEIGPLARAAGRHAFVVTGATPDRSAPLRQLLGECEVAATTFAIAGEPTVAQVTEGARQARAAGCDLVIGFGGGSALDAAKAIAALATNEGGAMDYVEVIGQGRVLERPPLPCFAVPTTAGTGAEVTRNAVLTSPEHHLKVSLRSPLLLPRLALVDPELTRGLPPSATAATGLDALTQLIEAFVSCRSNPVHRRTLPRRACLRRPVARTRLVQWRQPGCARGHVPRGPLEWPGPGQRGPGRRAWLCRARRRTLLGAARRRVRDPSAAGHADQSCRLAGARPPASRAGPLRGSGCAADSAAQRPGRSRYCVGGRSRGQVRPPALARLRRHRDAIARNSPHARRNPAA
jgi:hypothetical protein